MVTISHGGYAKSQPLAAYQAQRRGGKGKSATGMKDEDYIEHLLVANSHATLLLFSSKGKVYWLRTFEIPEASRTARGRPLVNLLPLDGASGSPRCCRSTWRRCSRTAAPMTTSTKPKARCSRARWSSRRGRGSRGRDRRAGGRADRRLHLHGHRLRYREEDPAGAVQPSAQQRPDRALLEERHPDRRRDHRWRQGSHAVLQRRQGDPLRRAWCASWAATPAAYAACAWAGAAADLHADSGVRGADPHRLRARLRQAYPAEQVPRRGRGGQG